MLDLLNIRNENFMLEINETIKVWLGRGEKIHPMLPLSLSHKLKTLADLAFHNYVSGPRMVNELSCLLIVRAQLQKNLFYVHLFRKQARFKI